MSIQIPTYLQMESWPLPITFRVGVAMDALNTKRNRLTVALDALHPNDNTESVNVGFEYSYFGWAFLRMGWQALFLQDDERSGLFDDALDDNAFPSNIGFGFAYGFNPTLKLKLDYAYADFGRLQNTQRFSIGIEF